MFGRAGFAGAMNGEVGAGDFGAGGEIPEFGGVKVGRGMGIADIAAGLAVKVDVLVQIGTVAGLPTLELDLLDESVRGEVLQAVINGGQGDVWGAAFHPIQDVIGRRVIGGGG